MLWCRGLDKSVDLSCRWGAAVRGHISDSDSRGLVAVICTETHARARAYTHARTRVDCISE